MTEQHYMLDLETLSLRTDAAIVAVGAYQFDLYGDDQEGADLNKMFYASVKLQSTIQSGGHVDGDTIEWWLKQSEEARRALLKDSLPLPAALGGLNLWIGTHNPPHDNIIWSHEGFDFPIIDLAYKRFNMVPPWSYRSGRDIRTIIHAAYGRNLDVGRVEPNFPANPIPHHAGYDAWHQAVMVQYCFRKLAS